MKIDSAFPSKYLSAGDLGDSQPVVQIARVAVEEVGRDGDSKPILYFVGKSKGMVLNKTNAKKIGLLCGSVETDDWAGKSIRLYATETEFAGETVPCIRVKEAGKNQPAPAPKPDADTFNNPDADIPF